MGIAVPLLLEKPLEEILAKLPLNISTECISSPLYWLTVPNIDCWKAQYYAKWADCILYAISCYLVVHGMV
jgi:hypothetical protein